MNATRICCGRFLGEARREFRSKDWFVSESSYPAKRSLPAHCHERAYFCLVRSGRYSEIYDGQWRECGPMTFAYHPAGEVHSEQFHEQEVLSFNIEAGPRWLALVAQETDLLSRPFSTQGGELSRLAEQLYRTFRLRGDCLSLLVEGAMLQIVATAASVATQPFDRREPRWVSRVAEMLRVRFATPPSHAELAAEVGVHPVYLASGFRRFRGRTIGDEVRRLRIESTSRQLLRSDVSIAAIAAAAGYSDQSHFTRSFKRATGLTPAEFRRAHGVGE